MLNTFPMRIIAHSVLHTLKYPKQFMSFLIKVGYVIADETISVGYANLFIDMIKGLKEGPLEYRLKMMRTDLNKEVNPDTIQNITDYFTQKAVYDKIKYKTPDQIKWNIKIDHGFQGIYKLWVVQKAEEMEAEGFGYLQNFAEEKTIELQAMPEEGYQFDNRKKITLESIFNSSINGPDGHNNILIFHDLHLNSDNFDNEDKFVSVLDPSAKDTSNSWFHYAATIPSFNQLTHTEIKIVRNAYLTKMAAFKEQFSQWVLISNSSSSNTESIQFFKDNIIPSLPAVESFFNNEEVLKYYQQYPKEDMEYHMYIGEITKRALLNYYLNFMPITEEVKKLLEEKFKLQGIYNNRIPVIIVSRLKDLSLPLDVKIYENIFAEPLENQSELQKRKFINIED